MTGKMEEKEGEEQGVWFVGEMKALMDWCVRKLVPVLSQKPR